MVRTEFAGIAKVSVHSVHQISLSKYSEEFVIKIPMSIVIMVNDVDRHVFRE